MTYLRINLKDNICEFGPKYLTGIIILLSRMKTLLYRMSTNNNCVDSAPCTAMEEIRAYRLAVA